MIKFPAHEFLTVAAINSAVHQVSQNSNPKQVIDDKGLKVLVKQYSDLERLCESMGLEFTLDEVRFVLHRLAGPGLTWGQFAELPLATTRRMRDEMKRRVCMYIPIEDCKYYANAALFGAQVKLNFPSASGNIESAGTCYALDSTTACVMHSMRVLEIGLRSLAKQFQVSFQHQSWDKVIGQIEKKIKLIESRRRKPTNWRQNRQFYSEAAIHFRFLKDAWRNYAMHVHENYDKPSALTILNHVGGFMQHLATRLKE